MRLKAIVVCTGVLVAAIAGGLTLAAQGGAPAAQVPATPPRPETAARRQQYEQWRKDFKTWGKWAPIGQESKGTTSLITPEGAERDEAREKRHRHVTGARGAAGSCGGRRRGEACSIVRRLASPTAARPTTIRSAFTGRPWRTSTAGATSSRTARCTRRAVRKT